MNITQSISRGFARKVVQTKANSPHIFFAAGVAGFLGTTVLACRATLKLEATVGEIHADLAEVREKGVKNGRDEAYFKEMGFVYAKTTVRVAKLYGPSVILGGLSVAALTGSHIQLTRRNTALAATLAAVSKAFDEYRIKIRNEIGDKRELEIYRGVEEETMVNAEGKKEQVLVKTGNGFSPYARLFDEKSYNWQPHAETNRTFLSAQQNYFNNRLSANGFVFLNEVYEQLGFERVPEGQIVGWVLENSDGDGYVDFGIYEAINGATYEPRIWLDFNVDGPILEKITRRK